MAVNTTKLKGLLYEALRRGSPEDRATFVAEHCGNELELKEMLESLIRAHEEAGDYLERPAGPVRQIEQLGGENTSIGRYRLLEKIGEGGFGVVFLAEQEEPVRRKVALKIIKAGMDTKQVIARFEGERQALAMMDHPNIAKVLDAGATENGRPYFVMELVRGIPITKFCEENQLTLKERIELFIPVCQAIQHAHQKGIIHRDIKPSNVLVTLNEDVPHAMVIDFGVAKAINQRLTEKTLFTNFAQMIGTPAYMSPEQAKMSKQDVDTRTDVYALGILLYELLTGTTPFPEERLKEVGYAETQRIICQEEPARPSTVLSRLNGKSRTIASNRRCEPAALMKLIKGDLDWIVLKAIDKDRNRRYATPLELAADLQRFLSNEPVSATPPSASYKLRKLVRRNRNAVAAVSAIILALVVGVAVATWQAIEASKARSAAEAALRFVQDDLLTQADPYLGAPDAIAVRDLKLVAALEQAANSIGDRYQDQPMVEAAIRLTLGKALRRLEDPDAAETHLQRALRIYSHQAGVNDPKTLETKQELAWLRIRQARHTEAEELSRQIVAVQKARFGPDQKQTLEALDCLAHACQQGTKDVEAVRLFEEILRRLRRSAAPDVLLMISAMQGLGMTYLELGHKEKSWNMFREAFETSKSGLGPDHPRTLNASVNVLTELIETKNAYPEADRFGRDQLERFLRVHGKEHPWTLYLQGRLVLLDFRRGLEYAPEWERLIDANARVAGPEHPYTLFEQIAYGVYLIIDRRFAEAEPVLMDALTKYRRTVGQDDLGTRRALQRLAGVYLAQQRYQEAEELWQELAESFVRLAGVDQPETRTSLSNLASVLARQGKWVEATEVYQRFLHHPDSEPLRHACALKAAALARDWSAAKSIVSRMIDRFGDTRNSTDAYELALALLLTPAGWAVPEATVDFCAHLIESVRDPEQQDLLGGILAYRMSNLSGDSDQPAKWAATAHKVLADLILAQPDLETHTARLACSFLALIEFEQGNGPEAEELWRNADDLLRRHIRNGDLGNTTAWPQMEWRHVAGDILALGKAEQHIHGQNIQPTIDALYLAGARETWKPVKTLLDQSESAARLREWIRAKDLLLEAMSHRQFDWSAAVFSAPELDSKAASLFAVTGDEIQYEKLCSTLIREGPHGPAGNPLPVLLSTRHPAPKIRQAALTLARWRAREVKGNTQPHEARLSHQLTLGMAEYRNGNDAAALAPLQEARAAYNLNISGTAHAYTAMALWNQGDRDNARTHFSQAKQSLTQILQSRTNDLGHAWHNTVILQLAVNEAGLKLGLNTNP